MVDSVAIVSGGLDSSTMLHYLVKEKRLKPAVLTFQYGQKHAREIVCARDQVALLGCRDHLVLDISHMRPLFSTSALVSEDVRVPDMDEVAADSQPSTYVPNRNLIFLALASAYAETIGVQKVYYGAQRHDMYGYWDTTPDFVARLNDVYRLNRKNPVQIHAPFVDTSKADIIRLGLKLGVEYGKTWSCYAGEEVACGRCPTCAERLAAFEAVGVSDPIPYARALKSG